MTISNTPALNELHPKMRQWRQHLHQYPETAFEEHQTAEFVANKLHEFGLEVHQGLGKTGVVGILKAGTSDKKIALRADMDALFIQEHNEFRHKSHHDGRMHACGHDGHTAMLLGAACHPAASWELSLHVSRLRYHRFQRRTPHSCPLGY